MDYISNSITKKGFLLFQLGTFFLVSAPNIAGALFLVSIILSHFGEDRYLKNTKFFIPFFISTFIALISCLFVTLSSYQLEGWESYLSWIGLANYIPFFYFAWRSQIYLYSEESREKVSNMFLAGTFPFIVSAFGQMWFQWHGPFVFGNGLIIWFQRYINFETGNGITAMFNNQNYAACWLIIVWPFCLNYFLKIKGFNLKRLVFFIFMVLLMICVLLTQSRNAYLGSFISSTFILNKLNLFILITLTFISLITSQLILKFNISELIIKSFDLNNISNFLNSARIFIYSKTLLIIMERPLFGWGAASFPLIFRYRNSEFIKKPLHSHNLFLEMSISYGLIFALIIFITILYILIYSYKLIYFKKFQLNKQTQLKNYDKAWWSSFFVLSCSQMVDFQYFDFRISISFWILLTGLICKIDSYKKNT